MHIETTDTTGVLANAFLGGKDLALQIATDSATREVKFSRVTGKLVGRRPGLKAWIVRTDRLPLNAIEKRRFDGLRFRQLADRWKQETAFKSYTGDIVLNDSYQRILAMGPAALPFVFAELRAEGDDPYHWFWALERLTGEDPVPSQERGNIAVMAASWLAWADEHGFTS